MMDGGVDHDRAAEAAHDADLLRRARDYRQGEAFAEWRIWLVWAELAPVVNRLADADRPTTAAMLCALLDGLGAGMPALSTYRDQLRGDAALWAEMGEPEEMLAYLVAILTELRRRDAFPRRLASRSVAELWPMMPAEDRRAFLARVDPRGELRGRG